MVQLLLAHSWNFCVFPELTEPFWTAFFFLFEHSMWSRSFWCPLWSGASGLYWSQWEIAQMAWKVLKHTRWLQWASSKHTNPDPPKRLDWRQDVLKSSMYILCADTIPAWCVDSSGFKAWLKTQYHSDQSKFTQNKILKSYSSCGEKGSKWHPTHTLTHAHSLSTRMGPIYTGATSTKFNKSAYTKTVMYINNWLLMLMPCNE